MNEQLQQFARESLKAELKQCTDGEQHLFKKMYAKTMEEVRDITVNEVVDNMDEDKLDWAMQQVKRTLEKRNV